ncbi:MAG TPA: GNAT family N-acetyltransferase [Acidimicrobiia bacterium]|nr:GNAT family N-acetyltransferase [Acidimicrobiia bacterium]
MPIRDATAADLPEILALVRELAAYERLDDQVVFVDDEFAEHLFGPDPVARVLLAETTDGTVAGFALWFRNFSTFLGRPGIWLEDLFVRPEHRGSGHGRALLTELFSRTTGRVEWAVLDWNESAQGFYRTLDASPVDGWTIWRRSRAG